MISTLIAVDIISIAQIQVGHVQAVAGLNQLADADIISHGGETKLAILQNVGRAACRTHGLASLSHFVKGAVRTVKLKGIHHCGKSLVHQLFGEINDISVNPCTVFLKDLQSLVIIEYTARLGQHLQGLLMNKFRVTLVKEKFFQFHF